MCHSEVEIIDAIMAVMLIEATMQGDSSIFGLEFYLYASSPENPRDSYVQLIRTILTKLELSDLLEKELEHIEDRRNYSESSNECQELKDESLLQNIFRRSNRTIKNIVISKRKSSENVSGEDNIKIKKIKLFSGNDQDAEIIENTFDSFDTDLTNCSGTNSLRSVYSQEDNPRESVETKNLDKDDDNIDVDELGSKRKKDKLDNNLLQNREIKSYLNRFRFIPRDPDLAEQSKFAEQNEVNCVKENLQEKEEITNSECQNSKIQRAEDEDISQNTINKRFINNFCYKPKAQVSEIMPCGETNSCSTQSKVYTQSIFEEPDCENLDLDL